ncbi:hypothetical protein [Paenibacillus sp. FSL H7-689]|uniref:hypothetical protein n=1 Tax=Paenibacillus sp. FSL H7-689 TaxID=1227349 RepID=UPI0003E24869|nr:hypothetical protein [Paenibacillus sp. FSL H7-689]ETT51276.1 F5/8 type C domain-containing protein [Paenibacillus sp. FSL H7-689]
MATIGQALLLAESGWQRIDNNNNAITYSGAWTSGNSNDFYNNTYTFTSTANDKVAFTFRGTKLRIIGAQYTTGSSDISIFIDEVEEKTTQNAGLVYQVLTYEKIGMVNKVHTVEIKNNQNAIVWIDAIDIDSSGEFGATGLYKTLVFHADQYKYINGTNWATLMNTIPTENDYKEFGIDDITTIPEDMWMKLVGEIEFCYYTTDSRVSNASFNIETEPFTLEEEWADKDIEVLYYTDDPNATESVVTIETDPFTLAEEWEDKEIKIIEYTDDPNQTESTITIETEPFTIYDELGDSVDVLYYTDDPSKTSAELNITANYSPLDELEGDFDVVTWTNDEEVIAGNRDMMLTYNALPFEQLIVQPTDIALYGDVKKVVATKVAENSPEGILRMAASFDSGLTWKTYRFNKWFNLDIQDTTLFKRKGMNLDTLNAIPEKDLIALTRIAYYFDSSKHYENSYSLDEVKMVVDAPRHAVEFRDMSLQLLNTTATIDLTFSGNKLTGVLDDADQGKVKYRVLLNGKTYYPADGNFTRLAASPFNIELNIDERNVNFGVENTLKVEFQDYWGAVDSREIKFIGSYSGLMFMDESGDFLSDTFGGILKQLDYGVIIAGQTTLTKKVRIKNLLGYAVDHVYLEMDKKFETDGVEVQLSRQADPFLPIDYLTYSLIQPEDSIDFYIRIATDIHAKPNPNGNFEMKVTADRV